MVKTAPPDGFEETAKSGPPDGFESSGPPDGYETRSFPQRAGALLNKVLDPVAEKVKKGLEFISPGVPRPYGLEDIKHPSDLLESNIGEKLTGIIPGMPDPRLVQTTQIPMMIAQQFSTDKLLKMGANKYVALAGGMIAGAIADPINLIVGTEIVKGMASASKARQALKMDMVMKDAENAAKFSASQDISRESTDWHAQKVGAESKLAEKTGSVPPGEQPPKPSTYEGAIPPDQPAYTPAKEVSSPVSEATSHLETPISTFYAPKEPPTRFDNWSNSAIKELDDLNSSRELASPSETPHEDFSKTFRRYVGHQELARFDAMKMTDEFAVAVPDRSRRTLITLYSQLGRAPTIEELNTIRTTLVKVKSPYAKALSATADELMGHNLSLTPEETAALTSYNRYFQGIGENAQKIGILDQMRDLYGGPHVYEPKADAEMGFFRKLVTGKTKFAQPRSFDNAIEAVQAGYVPKTLDSAELLSIYHNNISRAASERYLMDTLEKQGLINYEGRGRQIKGFQSGVVKIKNQIYKKIPYSDNTEIQKVMARAAEDPVLDYPIIHGIERLNNLQKLGSLYLQVFHPKALAMEAMGKGFSPSKFKAGLELIDANPEYVRGMIRSGLTVNTIADVGKQLSANAVRDYQGAHPVQVIRKINDIYTGWVFGKYMTGLKVWNSNVLAKRFVDMGLAPERAMELAVEDSNRTFGQLNLKLLNRSPNMQRLFSMLAFAPDWTESRLRQMAGVAGRGFGDVTSAERQMLALESWKYWSRTTAIAATTHLANQLNPYDKIISIDMSAESGYKDVTKIAKLLKLDPVYFRSKLAAVPRTVIDFMDPRLSTERKFQSLVTSPLMIPIQNAIRELQKEDQ